MNIPKNFPPVVYLPCTDEVSVVDHAALQFRTTRDGRSAVLAYSALDRLHTCCGDGQPWMLVPLKALQQFHDAMPFDLLLLDVALPESERVSS